MITIFDNKYKLTQNVWSTLSKYILCFFLGDSRFKQTAMIDFGGQTDNYTGRQSLLLWLTSLRTVVKQYNHLIYHPKLPGSRKSLPIIFVLIKSGLTFVLPKSVLSRLISSKNIDYAKSSCPF